MTMQLEPRGRWSAGFPRRRGVAAAEDQEAKHLPTDYLGYRLPKMDGHQLIKALRAVTSVRGLHDSLDRLRCVIRIFEKGTRCRL